MDVIEKFLHEVSWKFDKGYPDITNEQDMKMLNELAQSYIGEEEITDNREFLKEQQSEYDAVIKAKLKVEEIPTSKNKYTWNGSGGATFSIQVKPDDLEIWQELWTAKPSKKTGDKTETLGVGKGELSLYWLYNYSNSGVKVTEGRDGDDPDLFFDGGGGEIGVEVKAYGKHTGKNKIGRFGTDKDSLKLLSVIFGIDALIKVLNPGEKSKTTNPFNFDGNDLKTAMEQVQYLMSVDLSGLSNRYDLFKTIADNIELVQSSLGGFSDPEQGAIAMAKKLIVDKLGRKPNKLGEGYLASIKLNGDCKFFSIKMEKTETPEILNNMSVTQAALNLDFDKVFG